MDHFFIGFADELCKLAGEPSEIVERLYNSSPRRVINHTGPLKGMKTIEPAHTLQADMHHLFPVGKQSMPSGAKTYETTPVVKYMVESPAKKPLGDTFPHSNVTRVKGKTRNETTYQFPDPDKVTVAPDRGSYRDWIGQEIVKRD